MLNPIFNYVQQYEIIRKVLNDKFNVKLEDKQFKTSKEPYLFLALPTSDTKQITLGKMKMELVEHHFTIPQTADKKTNSLYHYTIVFQNSQREKFRVHLYFDKLDHISVEPKLFAFTEAEESLKFINLGQDDINKVVDLCCQNFSIILFLREQHKTTLKTLDLLKKTNDAKLIELCNNIENNKQACIDLSKQQINYITTMEQLGVRSYCAERKYHLQTIEMLLNPPPLHIVEPTPKLKTAVSQEHKSKKEVTEKTENQPKETKKQPKKAFAQSTQKVDNSQSTLLLMSNIQKCISQFDSCTLKEISSNLLTNMISLSVGCDAETLISNNQPLLCELFKLKKELTTRIMHYFNQVEFADATVYLQAVQANIIMMSDKIIENIVKNDNVKLLKQVLSNNLISESTKYRFAQGQAFTIVEWCVHYSSDKCFKELLNNHFSLNYIDEANSPFYRLLEDPVKSEAFLSINDKMDNSVLHRFYERIISLLENRLKKANPNEAALLQTQIKITKTVAQIHGFLSKNPMYKAALNNSQNKSNVDAYVNSEHFDAKKFETIRQDIEFQKASLESVKQLLALLKVIKPKYIAILKLEVPASSPEEVARFFNLPIKNILSTMKGILNANAKKFKLYVEILQSNEVIGFKNGLFMFKRNNAQAQHFIQQLKDLQDPLTMLGITRDASLDDLLERFKTILSLSNNLEFKDLGMDMVTESNNALNDSSDIDSSIEVSEVPLCTMDTENENPIDTNPLLTLKTRNSLCKSSDCVSAKGNTPLKGNLLSRSQ